MQIFRSSSEAEPVSIEFSITRLMVYPSIGTGKASYPNPSSSSVLFLTFVMELHMSRLSRGYGSYRSPSLKPTLSVSMQSALSLMQSNDNLRRLDELQHPAPADNPLTPAEAVALLTVASWKNIAARELLDKMKASTVRAGRSDYDALEARRYARRKLNGYHELTPLGQFKATQLIHDLGREYGIAALRRGSKPSALPRSGTIRLHGMSDSGNA